MSRVMTNGDTSLVFFAAEGALERVEEQFLLDADPGSPGCMFLIPADDILIHTDTGKEKSYPGGQTRKIYRVMIRKDCDAVRLEHVRLNAGLLSALRLRSDTDFEIDFASPCQDSGVLLVHDGDEEDGIFPPFVADGRGRTTPTAP